MHKIERVFCGRTKLFHFFLPMERVGVSALSSLVGLGLIGVLLVNPPLERTVEAALVTCGESAVSRGLPVFDEGTIDADVVFLTAALNAESGDELPVKAAKDEAIEFDLGLSKLLFLDEDMILAALPPLPCFTEKIRNFEKKTFKPIKRQTGP